MSFLSYIYLAAGIVKSEVVLPFYFAENISIAFGIFKKFGHVHCCSRRQHLKNYDMRSLVSLITDVSFSLQVDRLENKIRSMQSEKSLRCVTCRPLLCQIPALQQKINHMLKERRSHFEDLLQMK
jgi:hypothetical protein